MPRRLAIALAAACAAMAAALPAAQATNSTPPCRPVTKETRAALADIAVQARSGLEVPPGAIEPPALVKGQAAQVLVRLGPDPLGVAESLHVDPVAFWGAARASLSATGPGFYARTVIQADGSASLSITPPEPGGVTMRMYLSGRDIQRAMNLCSAPIKGIPSPLVHPGAPPGSPVLEVEDRPVEPPDPGGETSPDSPPIPGPEPAPVGASYDREGPGRAGESGSGSGRGAPLSHDLRPPPSARERASLAGPLSAPPGPGRAGRRQTGAPAFGRGAPSHADQPVLPPSAARAGILRREHRGSRASPGHGGVDLSGARPGRRPVRRSASGLGQRPARVSGPARGPLPRLGRNLARAAAPRPKPVPLSPARPGHPRP